MKPKRMPARYAGTCSNCKRRFDAGTDILYDGRARHATDAGCFAAAATQPEPPASAWAPAPTATADLRPIVAFLEAAHTRGLQYPKARFIGPGGAELRLSLAGSTSRFPGAVQVLVGEQWLGRIMPDGRVGRPLADDGPTLEVLRRIGVDPAAAAHEYGATNGVCSYCNTELTDAGSVEVGYGPVCAKRYGLPHQPRGSQIGKVA